jgi:dolichol-phosphate mannosyltransferase
MGQSARATPLISVVIPTRNEAGNVEALVERISAVLGGVPAELIFVDDSSDQTPTLLRALASAPPSGLRIEVLHREPAQQTGLGSAAADGLKLARGEVVAVMDGDLQHPPDLLTTMVRRLEAEHLDLVVASRYVPGGSARGLNGPARVLVSRLSKVVAQVLFREARKTSDPLSGYFVCRRDAIEGLEFRPIGFKILLEVLVCAASARVGDVPLSFQPRHAGSSNASMAQGLKYLSHLWSLLLHVPGSARFWKYAAVGSAGLAIFLGILTVADRLGAGPFLAWTVAFGVSLFLNWQLNRVLTFADVASPFTAGRGRPIYLPVALVGGVANLLVFLALLVLQVGTVLAGLGGAVAAMALNFLVHRRVLRRPPRPTPGAGRPQGAIAERVARQVGAAVEVLDAPVDGVGLDAMFPSAADRPPRELLRAAQTARPLMLAEAPSHKPQARTDIGVHAWMSVPLVEGDRFLGLLLLHREGRAFSGEELDIVLRSLRAQARPAGAAISPLLAADDGAN